MSVMNGTYSDGRVQLAGSPDWPDGTPVRVVPVAEAEVEPEGGMREEDWKTDPDSIAAWVAMIDALEPLILTPEDKARIREARADQLRIDSAAADALEAAVRGAPR